MRATGDLHVMDVMAVAVTADLDVMEADASAADRAASDHAAMVARPATVAGVQDVLAAAIELPGVVDTPMVMRITPPPTTPTERSPAPRLIMMPTAT